MEQLLAWYNLIFYIPIAAGLVLAMGSAFGAGHDSGHDHETAHAPSLAEKGFAALGVGRVPLTIVLMMTSLLFGGIGAIVNLITRPAVYPWLSIPVATGGMFLLSGQVARLFHRWLPSSESYSVSRQDLVGMRGTLVLDSDTTWGLAQVRDPAGDLHQITCQTTTGQLSKGEPILVVDYSAETGLYLIAPRPQ